MQSTLRPVRPGEKQTFGHRLRAARMRAGLSLQALGLRIGVSLVSVHNWESDTLMPRSSRLDALAAALGVTRDYLLGGSDRDSNR